MNSAGLAARCRDALIAQIAAAEQALQRRPLRDERVHAARKTIKKARAALRLLREGLGERVYQKENKALRDAGRCLAVLRDAKSLAEAWQNFCNRHPRTLQHAGYDVLARRLRANLAARHRALVRAPASLQQCAQTLTSTLSRITRRQAGPDGAVAGGLTRIVRAGRKALVIAQRSQTPEALHEWRKHVKYLSNALRIIDSESSYWRSLATRTAKLADQLGEDHDLAELDGYVGTLNPPALKADEHTLLSTLIERRRKVLQKRAFALGKTLYEEKPAPFVRRLLGKRLGNKS